MNVPLVMGGVAAAAGITAGVLAERRSHDSLEADKQRIQNSVGDWMSGMNTEFGDDIEADRLRNRDLDSRIEDYTLDHPMPPELSWGRDGASYSSSTTMPGRDGFWGLSLGAAGLGGAVVGGFTLTAAIEGTSRGARTAAGVGAAVLAGGLGAAAGAIISNWTH